MATRSGYTLLIGAKNPLQDINGVGWFSTWYKTSLLQVAAPEGGPFNVKLAALGFKIHSS